MGDVMDRIAFEGINLIDGRGNASPAVTVLIDGKQIEQVGPRHQVAFDPEAYLTVDGDGLWLLPGLINCHDHVLHKSRPLGTGAGRKPEPVNESPGFYALESARGALMELHQGVTTIREMAGPSVSDIRSPGYTNVDLRDAIEAGLAGPRILACRLAVTMTGGHGYPAFAIREADGPDEVRKAVREQVKGGADFIKIMSSGGFSHYPHEDPRTAQLTVEELRAAADEAHRQSRLITAHAIADQGIRNSIEGGIDTIEHGFLMAGDTVKMMVDRQLSFVPTARVVLKMQTGQGPLAEFVTTVVPGHREAVQRAAEAGVLLGVGTDSRAFMIDEMEALVVDYGLSPMDVVVAATGSAAAICGLQQVGTIEPGKLADLLILGADPLRDVRGSFGDVRAVVKEGQPMASVLPELGQPGG
jgi:imidazolonepropionase-like amidohydrolase